MRRCCPFSQPPSPPFPEMWATSWWLNQANSAVQDRRGRKRMEEGRNEPWLLSWYELRPRDSPKTMGTDSSSGNAPTDSFCVCVCVCVCERDRLQRLDEVNHKWSQWTRAGRRKDMCHHTQEVFCYAVWLRKTGCWCLRCSGGRDWGLSELAEDLPNRSRWIVALTWRPGRTFSLTRDLDWIKECWCSWQSGSSIEKPLSLLQRIKRDEVQLDQQQNGQEARGFPCYYKA